MADRNGLPAGPLDMSAEAQRRRAYGSRYQASEDARLRAEVARLQALLAASPLRVAPSEHDGSAA